MLAYSITVMSDNFQKVMEFKRKEVHRKCFRVILAQVEVIAQKYHLEIAMEF